MQIIHQASLADFSTMKLGGTVAHAVEIRDRETLLEALTWASTQNLPTIMIGGGSNIVWQDDGFAGLLLINKIGGYEVLDDDGRSVVIRIGAGENWDGVVARAAEAGLTGIESLSLIPGSAGATPVQNVGAYGQEIAQTLIALEAFDRQTNDFVVIGGEDCDFGYRASRFKGADRGRFFIVSITLRLQHGNPQPPFYPALQHYLVEHGQADDPTPAIVREAVIAIRASKLPDPAVVANNGSFFANPIISEEQLEHIQTVAEGLAVPHWPTHEGLFKVSAAWLVEQAGFKDHHDEETGMATWSRQPLVLVNEHARSTADLLRFKQKVVDGVQAKFGITLVQEPELLP